MCSKNPENGQTTEDIGDAVELITRLSIHSDLWSAIVMLYELFPTRVKDISYRFRGKQRTPDVDLDIIKFYIECGGDINKRNKEGVTCLETTLEYFLTTETPHLILCPKTMSNFLIERGADVNARNKQGRTVLHELIANAVPLELRYKDFSISRVTNMFNSWLDLDRYENDRPTRMTALHGLDDNEDPMRFRRIEMVKYLLAKGADPFIRDFSEEDVISEACKQRREDLIHLIFESCPPENAAKVITSLELFGARHFLRYNNIYKAIPNSTLNKGIGAWLLANRLKQSIEIDVNRNPDILVNNTVYTPGSQVVSDAEFQLMRPSTELESMHLRALNILENILGPVHQNTFHWRLALASRYIIGPDHRNYMYHEWLAVLKDCFRQIYRFGLPSCKRNELLALLVSSLWRLFDPDRHDILDRNFCAGNYVTIAEYLQDIIDAVIEVRDHQNSEHEPIGADEYGNLISLMSFIVVLLSCTDCSTSEIDHFRQLLRKAVKLNSTAACFSTCKDKTLLLEVGYIYSIQQCLPFERRMTKPISFGINLLLECGADVNARDRTGHTIFDCIASKSTPRSKYFAERHLVRAFVDHGLHTDVKTRQGMKVSDVILKHYGIVVRVFDSLQCLAARAIRSNNLPYKELLPQALSNFVELH